MGADVYQFRSASFGLSVTEAVQWKSFGQVSLEFLFQPGTYFRPQPLVRLAAAAFQVRRREWILRAAFAILQCPLAPVHDCRHLFKHDVLL